MNTYCKFLWSNLFINVKGDVYFCCRYCPDIIGNIYKDNLEEIWNNEKAQFYRKQSIDGHLRCHKTCMMFSKENKYNLPQKTLHVKTDFHLNKLHIEIHEFCNIKCIMCYQKDLKERKLLKKDLLIGKIDFSKIDEVQIQGGEPFMIEDTRQFIKQLLINYDTIFTIQTNGLIMDNEIIEMLTDRGAEIMIAINGGKKATHEKINKGSSFEKLISNIKKLVSEKERKNSSLRIEGQMTLMPENVRDIPDFLDLANELNLDSVAFSWVAGLPKYIRIESNLQKEIHKRLVERDFHNHSKIIKKKHLDRLKWLTGEIEFI